MSLIAPLIMTPRALAVADQALVAGQYGAAMHGYLKAAEAMPALANTLAANLALTRHKFLTRPENSQGLRIVLSSQLAMGDGAESRIDRPHQHVPAGQIRSGTLALFVDEMLWLVAERPAEVLHLCEVSGPSLIIGMLYRCLWGARVVIDVNADDRRLIEAEPAYDVANFWRKCFSETGVPDLCDDEWRMLARAVFRAFDAVTLDGFHKVVAKNDCFPALTSVLARVQALVVEAKPLLGLVNQWVAALAYRPGAQAILPAAPVDTGVRWRACWPNRLVNKSLGFNLVGYATSPIGLGEDLRQSAVALIKAGIPITIIDVETDVSGTCSVGLERYIKQSCDQPATIFFMSPFAFSDYLKTHAGLFAGTLRVGNFLWELEDIPALALDGLSSVDEVWVPTRFVADAYRQAGFNHVYLNPTPSLPLLSAGRSLRDELALGEDIFVFGFMFDVQSVPQRKNPLALLAAYRHVRSLLPSTTKTALLLKILRSDTYYSSAMNEIRAMAAAHQDIILLEKSLNNVADFYATIDAYVSLHRSEGLGRTIIEAAQQGIPVICSNYSGSSDLVCLGAATGVPGDLVPCRAGDYPFNEGSFWGEPNSKIAAREMLELVRQGRKRHPPPGILNDYFSGEAFVARINTRFAVC